MRDKPRIRLHVWYDCGWEYRYWHCSSGGCISGIGQTPKSAYQDWLTYKTLYASN